MFLVLLATLAPTVVQEMAFSVRRSHSSACHDQQSQENRVPAHADYQCCIGTHDVAIISATFRHLPVFTTVSLLDSERHGPAAVTQSEPEVKTDSLAPPGLLTRRI